MTANPAYDTLNSWIATNELVPHHWSTPDPDCGPAPCVQCLLSMRLADVAEGMLELARIDPAGTYVRESGPAKNPARYPGYHAANTSRTVTARWNSAICTPSSVSYWDEFGPGRALGLMAITLEVAYSTRGERLNSLGLALPLSHVGWNGEPPTGYTVLTINNRGDVQAFRYGGTVTSDSLLGYSLGLTIEPLVITQLPDNHTLDEMVFPGIVPYLPDALSRLRTFLTELARSIKLNQTL